MRRFTTAAALCLTLAACERTADENAALPAPDLALGDSATTAADSTVTGTSVEDSLRTVLGQLVRGERIDPATDSASWWFSERTANVLRAVSVDSAGRATVDLADLRALIPNASSSAGSESLLRELNAAVFSVGGITSVEYRVEGSCESFSEWLQYGGCLTYDRDSQE